MAMGQTPFLYAMRQQLDRIQAIASREQVKLHHIKAHGALYHDTVEQAEIAGWFATAVAEASRCAGHPIAVITMHDGELAAACQSLRIAVIREAYADRGYHHTESGKFRLIPRSSAGALVTDPQAAARQAVGLVETLPVDSVCVHSDTPGAAQVLQAVAKAIKDIKH
jgi:UPF0271 protein